jgi:hypothetical protein
MGAPGIKPDDERAGVGRGGIGAPGTDGVAGPVAGGPGATKCVGGCGNFGCGGGSGVEGLAELSGGVGDAGTAPGRTERSGISDVRGRVSPGKGCRGPLGTAPPAEDPGMGIGAGRAGIEMDRLIGPGAAG